MEPSKFQFLMYERNGIVVLDPIGTLLAMLLVVVIGMVVSQSRLPHTLKKLVYVALALRVVGSFARYVVLFAVYGGSGDAREYYSRGLANAAELWNFNLAPLFSPENWTGGKWWGTQFVFFPSTLVQTFLGASMPGGFIVFSLFAFVGLCGFVVAFHRNYPWVPIARYARWVWLFPALWFWPSSIGKEAIVLLGLGLVIAGYVGRNGRINWLLLAVGGFIIFGIRPQVAAVVIASLMFAHWLSLLSERWTFRNTIQAVALGVVGIVGLYFASSFMGIESFDTEGVTAYMEDNKGRDLRGGSSMEAVDVGLAGVPLALINILMRPFIWEASSLMVLVTSLEIMLVWAFAWSRRRVFLNALRHWRHDRLLRVAIPFIVLYSISLGMVLANMGIITRQRIFIFPFLFMLFEAIPARSMARRAPAMAARRRPLPPPRHPVAANSST
jgi:hypothetical protein